MADKFLGALKELERKMHLDLNGYSKQNLEQLDEIAKVMAGQAISDNDYLKVMELYARKYEQLEQKKACQYCVMRMQEVLQAKTNPKIQANYPGLTFSSSIDSFTKEFLQPFKNYNQEYKIDFKIKLLRFDTMVMIILLALLVLVMKISFVIGWIFSFLVFIGIFVFGVKISFPRLIQEQMDSFLHHVDSFCEEVDKSVRKHL